MEDCCDFIQWLGADMSIKILMCLDNPADLVRASAVSSSWRQFGKFITLCINIRFHTISLTFNCVLLVANGLSKQLCIRMFPKVSSVISVVEMNNRIEHGHYGVDGSMEWPRLEKEHRVYAFLARGFTSFMRRDCILEAIVASSTDNYPQESIHHTLEPGDRVDQRASYWSSEGEVDPSVPETLVYKLIANLCVITEIHIHPFQGYTRNLSIVTLLCHCADKISVGLAAYFQFGFPIYSAKAVRFRLGHVKPTYEIESDMKDESTAALRFIRDNVVWTYTSPSFPMAQESRLQKFKLPEPALCIGGILQIDVSHVQVMGRPLSPAFDVDIIDSSGLCSLKYYSHAEYCCSPPDSPEGEASSSPSRFRSFTASIRGWEQMILNTLLGGGVVVGNDDSDDEVVG
ncbi:F-box domain, cyclin-like protein [Cynara cardunculus var. scolymus]|uniref:F-box domain, cyclin-like protein n=1 Tax=Cynara cardunculus var. scolymus TaxID=59895 RepID=A0A103YJC5_CYNCS|nr:F-box domain, cyclin-like protein [Cynara cardunculus var. scolymus]